MELFTPKNTTKEKMVGTAVKSITTEFKSDNINVNLSFPLKIKCNTSTTQCRYLDPSTGQWLTEGVTTICDGRKTICQSTHLTSFAVLVSYVINNYHGFITSLKNVLTANYPLK